MAEVPILCSRVEMLRGTKGLRWGTRFFSKNPEKKKNILVELSQDCGKSFLMDINNVTFFYQNHKIKQLFYSLCKCGTQKPHGFATRHLPELASLLDGRSKIFSLNVCLYEKYNYLLLKHSISHVLSQFNIFRKV